MSGRRLLPAAVAVILAFLIELGAQETGWAAAWTYSLIGFAVACLILVGGPYAMSLQLSRPADAGIDDGRGEEAIETAIVASSLIGVVAISEVQSIIVLEDWEVDSILTNRPLATATGRTPRIRIGAEPRQYSFGPSTIHGTPA